MLFHDIMSAILLYENNEMSQTNPVGVEPFSSAKTFFVLINLHLSSKAAGHMSQKALKAVM